MQSSLRLSLALYSVRAMPMGPRQLGAADSSRGARQIATGRRRGHAPLASSAAALLRLGLLLLAKPACEGQGAVPAAGGVAPQPGVCSSIAGSPIAKQVLHDGTAPVQIINSAFRLPAGTITSWTLFNHGAAAPISLQAWRPVDDARSFQLVCHYDTMLIPGAQTIQLVPPQGTCDVEDGDSIGWWQSGGSAVGGIAYVSEKATDWDPGCEKQRTDTACFTAPHKPECACPVCNNRYGGVLWLYPQARTADGGKLSMNGCGLRTYSVAVEVSGECFARDWGSDFIATLLGLAALYVLGGYAYSAQRGAEGHPHQGGWLHAAALVQDGLAFVRARGRQRGGGGGGGSSSRHTPLLSQSRGGGGGSNSDGRASGGDSSGKSGSNAKDSSKKKKEQRGSRKDEKHNSSRERKGREDHDPPSDVESTAGGERGRWVHIPT